MLSGVLSSVFQVSSISLSTLGDVKHETSNVQLETDPLSVLMMT